MRRSGAPVQSMTYSSTISGGGGGGPVPAPAPVPAPNSILLFYSKKCPYCLKYLEELQKTPYAREFRFICVDAPSPGQPRPPLPAYVKKVPTMVVPGEADARTEFIQCMNWIVERKRLTPSAGAGAGAGTGSTGHPGLMSGGVPLSVTPAPPVVPEAWTQEMGNASGSTTFTDLTLSYTGVPLSQMDIPHAGRMDSGMGPGSGPGMGSGSVPDPRVAPSRQSAKSAALTSQFETFLKERNAGVSMGPGFGPGPGPGPGPGSGFGPGPGPGRR